MKFRILRRDWRQFFDKSGNTVRCFVICSVDHKRIFAGHLHILLPNKITVIAFGGDIKTWKKVKEGE